MRTRHAGAVVGLFVGAAVFAGAPPASAACHAFTVTVNPSNPVEGSTVTATISRDAAVRPSSVRVTSVDGTAHAGQDYVAVDQRVEFSGEISKTITVSTTQDTLDEPDETFALRLSEGGGCEVNPNFQYGSPATITIRDDDAPSTTTPPATTHATSTTTTLVAVVPSTSRPTTTGAANDAPSLPPSTAPGSTSGVASGASSSSSIATETASTRGHTGGSNWPVVLGSLVLLGVAGGGVTLARRRRPMG